VYHDYDGKGLPVAAARHSLRHGLSEVKGHNRVRRQITVQIKGSAEDGGYLRISEFLKQLDAIKTALKHTERLLSGSDERSVYYRIVKLSMASPATVVMEETAIRNHERRGTLPKVPIAQRFVSNMRQIERRGTLPHVKDLQTLEAYRDVGTLLHKHVESVILKSAKQEVSIGEEFNRRIDKIIGPDQIIEGSVTGVLLAINLHNTTRFEIYPAVGPTKVACDFSPELKKRVIEGLDHNVRVIGKLRYKHWAPYPHAITADDLDVFPPDNELPTLLDLRGLIRTEQPDDTPHVDAD
jgi:hypothetical protein